MKSKKNKSEAKVAPALVEDKATEKLKKRAQDLGLIVDAGKDKPGGKKKGGGK